MSKKYKLHFKSLGKVFLTIGIIFAVSGITNANAQIVNVRCKKWSKHSHLTRVYGYSHSRWHDTCWKNSGDYLCDTGGSNIDFCVEWEVNINDIINAIPSKDKGTFRTKVIESLNTMELQKIYDPNLLRN